MICRVGHKNRQILCIIYYIHLFIKRYYKNCTNVLLFHYYILLKSVYLVRNSIFQTMVTNLFDTKRS